MDRENINIWDESNFDSDLDWIYFSIWIITFDLMIHDDPERGLKGLQLLCWLLFLILSFGKLYLAINMPTSCRSELNIHIKSSLEIRGGLKFRNNQLFLSFDLFSYSFQCYKYPTHQNQRDEQAESRS